MTDRSRRGAIPGLGTSRPLMPMLPAVYLERQVPLLDAVTGALDHVIAPIVATLDNLPAYFDPALAPADFLDWLAGWVGIQPAETWPEERRRKLVSRALHLYALRGTAQGLREVVEIFTGLTPDIEESGGIIPSKTAGSSLPGAPEARMKVRLTAPPGETVDESLVRSLVAAVKPAHVVADVELVATA